MSVNYQYVTTEEGVLRACEELARAEVLGEDCETTSLSPRTGKLRLVQLAASPENVAIFDIFRFENPRRNPALEPLRRILRSKTIKKVAHQSKFEQQFLGECLGVEVSPMFDTLLASKLLDHDEAAGLAPVLDRYLDIKITKEEQLSDWSHPELSTNQLLYAASDAAHLPALRSVMYERLRAARMLRVAQIEFDCAPVTAALELAGFYLDRSRYEEYCRFADKERELASAELMAVLHPAIPQGGLFAGVCEDRLNLDSNMDVGNLFRQLGVPLEKDTSDKALQRLVLKGHKELKPWQNYRKKSKQVSSYGWAFLEKHYDEQTSRVYADFNQIGAPTGRFACTRPNVQNVPHEKIARRCYTAPEGRKLLIGDYSQIELRILAQLCRDEKFVDAFCSGKDFHAQTASDLSVDRDFAKRLNFGVVYGISSPSLAEMLAITVGQSETLLTNYYRTYPGLDRYLKEREEEAVSTAKSRTMGGRLVKFGAFDKTKRSTVNAIRRNGRNAPVQGTAADMFKRAMVRVYRKLRELRLDAFLVNIVHDEQIVECEASIAEEVKAVVEHEMVAAGEEFVSAVPVKVEIAIANDWSEKP